MNDDMNTMPIKELVKAIRIKCTTLDVLTSMVMNVMCNRIEELIEENDLLRDDKERLIAHSALLGRCIADAPVHEEDPNDSFRSLPDHLQTELDEDQP